MKNNSVAQIFISYSRKDLQFVERLASDLKQAGCDVWYDYLRLRGGERWRIEIQDALKACQHVITVLSPDSVQSEWVEREFLFANSLPRRSVPLLYRDCELPLNYVDLNYIDVRGENYGKNFEKILEVLNESSAASPIVTSTKGKPTPRRRYPQTVQKDRFRLRITWLALVFLLAFSMVAGWYWTQQQTQSSDRDQDGLTYAAEIEYGCSPDQSDSDRDDLIDSQEKEWKTYCRDVDSDKDGLSDGEEVLVRKTNPGNGDTDADYLWDGEEVLVKNSDPRLRDTDGDGLFDADDAAPRQTSTPSAGGPPPAPTTPAPVGESGIQAAVYWDQDNDGRYTTVDTLLAAVLELYAGSSCSGTSMVTSERFLAHMFSGLEGGVYCVEVINESIDTGGRCALIPRFGRNTKVYQLATNQTIEDFDSGFPYVCQ